MMTLGCYRMFYCRMKDDIQNFRNRCGVNSHNSFLYQNDDLLQKQNVPNILFSKTIKRPRI